MAQTSPRPRAFRVMVKPRGPVCNLACGYCYYLAKEKLYPGSDFRMSDAVLDSFTRQYIEAQQAPEVTFVWQGGEPLLMGVDFFARAIAWQKQYRRPGMHVTNTLQTNGTLVDEAWGEFFQAHDFLIGLSLDGPQAMHDVYRRDKGGAPTWERVMRACDIFHKYGVEYNILCTVHQANAAYPRDVYRFFRDEVQAQFIQFIPIVQRDTDAGDQEGTALTASSVTARQYGDFLIGVFDEWVHHDVGRVFVQLFDVALAAWMGQRPGLCVFAPTCGLELAMEHNGDLYACDHFVAPRYRLGNIIETPLVELVAAESQRRFGQDKRDALPQLCRDCAVRFVCNGECPKNRLLAAAAGEPGLNYLCAGYKSFFTHIDHPMRMMAEELRQHRAPANVMRRLRQEEADLAVRCAQAGRNDPCPCGSGKKFKHCHGR
ncbi:MAG TPA: anaerobic sulfatase maturase [Anaerolineae bacterium]|nr:anaerobic sulfatase maturase [Anaerolineae bacterium]HQH37100.1 anaerobic sulfatase maturase [Anaerolineae bacterium]